MKSDIFVNCTKSNNINWATFVKKIVTKNFKNRPSGHTTLPMTKMARFTYRYSDIGLNCNSDRAQMVKVSRKSFLYSSKVK